MNPYKTLFLILALAVLALSSCKKDDPVVPNEEEVITTMTYTIAPEGGGVSVVLSFQDLDGDGGTDPVITGGTLKANQNYTGVLDLLNEQESPAGDITEEVLEEAVDHQFFFQTDIPGFTINYNDTDSNNNPIGQKTTLTTGDPGSGTLTIILRHEPNKSGSGVGEGLIENAGGETDIEVSFDVEITE